SIRYSGGELVPVRRYLQRIDLYRSRLAVDLQLETVFQQPLQHQRNLVLCRSLRHSGENVEASDLCRIGGEFREPARAGKLPAADAIRQHDDFVETAITDAQLASWTHIQRRHVTALQVRGICKSYGCDFEFGPRFILSVCNTRKRKNGHA